MTYQRGDHITYTHGPLGAVNQVGDTKFLNETYDAQSGESGYYVEPIDIGGETWHVTSKIEPTSKRRSDLPFRGPFVIVSSGMFEHLRKNHQVTDQDDRPNRPNPSGRSS